MGELEFTVVVPCWQQPLVLADSVVAAAVAVSQMMLLAAAVAATMGLGN